MMSAFLDGNIKEDEVVNVTQEDIVYAEQLALDDRTILALVDLIFSQKDGQPPS
jgi:hypothetical protein